MPPLLALMVSTLGGLTLTPAFIHGWLGLPALGITSAAWATLVSMTVANLWLFWYLRRKRHVLAPDALLWRHLTLRRALLKPVAQLGLPTGLSLVTSSLSDLASLRIALEPLAVPVPPTTSTKARRGLFTGLMAPPSPSRPTPAARRRTKEN